LLNLCEARSAYTNLKTESPAQPYGIHQQSGHASVNMAAAASDTGTLTLTALYFIDLWFGVG